MNTNPHLIGQLTYRGADIIITVPGRTELHYRGTMSGARAYCERNGITCTIDE